jgi:hypothetical protein
MGNGVIRRVRFDKDKPVCRAYVGQKPSETINYEISL